MKNKSLQIIGSRSIKLTSGQLALYELIIEANKSKFVISKDRLKMIYLNKVQRNPNTWNYWHSKEKQKDGTWKAIGGYEPRSEWATNQNMMGWFTVCLGALIKKGYLTVIPRFNLQDAKELSK